MSDDYDANRDMMEIKLAWVQVQGELKLISTLLTNLQIDVRRELDDLRKGVDHDRRNNKMAFENVKSELNKKVVEQPQMDRLEAELDKKVSNDDFSPIKKIVYSLVGGVLAIFLAGVGSLLMHPTVAATTTTVVTAAHAK